MGNQGRRRTPAELVDGWLGTAVPEEEHLGAPSLCENT